MRRSRECDVALCGGRLEFAIRFSFEGEWLIPFEEADELFGREDRAEFDFSVFFGEMEALSRV
jgi:hypothetical protein